MGRFPWLVSVGWFLLVGCGSELTRYRTTAFIAAPRPPEKIGALSEQGQTELSVGAYQVAGDVGGLVLINDPALTLLAAGDAIRYGQRGDPGILQATHGGFFTFRQGINRYVELGGHLEVAGSDGAAQSRVGVLPLKGSRYATLIGPTMGFQLPLEQDPRFRLVFRLEYMAAIIPFTRYELIDGAPEGEIVEGSGAAYYREKESNSEMLAFFSLNPGVAFKDEALEFALGFSLVSHYTNDGFTYTELPPIEYGSPVGLFTGEIGYTVDKAFRVGLQSWVQLNDSDDHFDRTAFGARGSLTFFIGPKVSDEEVSPRLPLDTAPGGEISTENGAKGLDTKGNAERLFDELEQEASDEPRPDSEEDLLEW